MKTLKDFKIGGKKILLRADFNVTLENGKILDDFRIRATLPTIEYLADQNAKVILMSHLGRPEGEKNLQFSLKPIAKKLSELLDREVKFISDCAGEEAKNAADWLKEGEILLLENLRFYKEEEENDVRFAQKLASLGEIYVNDAFGVSHRAHASVEAITKILPSAAGLLLQKELEVLNKVKNNPDHPFVAVIGGSKISTKIELIESFMGKADNIILGGALANTVLLAKGIAVGKSMVEEDILPRVKEMDITSNKIHLPLDAILCVDKQGKSAYEIGPITKTPDNQMILDIGPDTEKLFAKILESAKMIVWNGPMGLFEEKHFAHGTRAVAEAIAKSQAYSVVGGGETVAFLEELGLVDKFDFVSTGGGAMMELLSGKTLPGVEALK